MSLRRNRGDSLLDLVRDYNGLQAQADAVAPRDAKSSAVVTRLSEVARTLAQVQARLERGLGVMFKHAMDRKFPPQGDLIAQAAGVWADVLEPLLRRACSATLREKLDVVCVQLEQDVRHTIENDFRTQWLSNRAGDISSTVVRCFRKNVAAEPNEILALVLEALPSISGWEQPVSGAYLRRRANQRKSNRPLKKTTRVARSGKKRAPS